MWSSDFGISRLASPFLHSLVGGCQTTASLIIRNCAHPLLLRTWRRVIFNLGRPVRTHARAARYTYNTVKYRGGPPHQLNGQPFGRGPLEQAGGAAGAVQPEAAGVSGPLDADADGAVGGLRGACAAVHAADLLRGRLLHRDVRAGDLPAAPAHRLPLAAAGSGRADPAREGRRVQRRVQTVRAEAARVQVLVEHDQGARHVVLHDVLRVFRHPGAALLCRACCLFARLLQLCRGRWWR